MFDVLVYLFENYYTPDSCPDADALAKRLTAAGFEDDEIDEALDWLSGLAQAAQDAVPLALSHTDAVRIYAEQEWRQLGSDAVGFISFLETAKVLSPTLREILIERALAIGESPVSQEKLKIIALMVLWSQEVEIDHLILDELLEDDEDRQLH
jgi:Smg protein